MSVNVLSLANWIIVMKMIMNKKVMVIWGIIVIGILANILLI